MKDSISFKLALAALAEEEKKTSGGHVSPEELAALAAGELRAEDEVRMRDHLVVCPDCFEAYRELEAFERPAAAGASELEIAAFRRSLRQRLDKSRQWRIPSAMAAVFLAALVGASLWAVRQQQRLAWLSAPQPNVPVYDLEADDSRRSGREATVLEIPDDTGFTLVLAPDGVEGYSGFQVRILSLADTPPREVTRVDGLARDPLDDSFTLGLASGFLAVGDYRLELHGLDAGESTLIEDYRIRIVRAGG